MRTAVMEEVELGMSKTCTTFFIILSGILLSVLTMVCKLGTGRMRIYLFTELLEPEETMKMLMNQLEWLDRWIKAKSHEDEYQVIDLDTGGQLGQDPWRDPWRQASSQGPEEEDI